MLFSAENALLTAAVILFVSIIFSKMSARFGLPVLLVFLLVGMLFGTDGLGLQFDDVRLTQFIGMVSMSVILFSGGLDTRIKEVRPVLGPGILLSTLGVILTTVITGTFIYLISKSLPLSFTLSFPFALLTAATMSSTDSASVFNILRSQRIGLKNRLRPLLELESGSNDPMAYMLTIVLIGVLDAKGMTAGDIAIRFLMQFLIGGAAGYLFGRLAAWTVNRINLQNTSLYPILLLAGIFIIFSVTDLAGGNGYLAIYLAGIVVGNRPLVKKHEISAFLDGMTWLFQIIMFLMLGLLVNPHEMLHIAPLATLIGIFMIVVARPLSVFLTLLPFPRLNFRSKFFISWVGLRGAAPIIFATYPVVAGIEGSSLLFNIVFFITLVSLLVQGTTITSIARALHLTAKCPNRGNTFGITIPEDIGSKLWEVDVTERMLFAGKRLMDVKMPKGVLVILIKRGEDYIIPNGSVEIKPEDKLLLISPPDQEEEPPAIRPEIPGPGS